MGDDAMNCRSRGSKGSSGLVDVVSPKLGAGLLDHPRHAAIVVRVAVGNDHPLDVAYFQARQRHSRPQQVEGGLRSWVNHRQPFVFEDVRPGWPGVRMSFLWHRHGVDASTVGVCQAQRHAVAGRIAVAQDIHLREVVRH